MALRRSSSFNPISRTAPVQDKLDAGASDIAQLQAEIDELKQRLAALEGVLTVTATGAHLKAGEVTIESQTALKVKGGYNVTVEAAGTMNVKGGSLLDMKAPLIKIN